MPETDAQAADSGRPSENLAINGTFEQLGCAGLLGDGLEVKPDSAARSGAGACRLCGTGGPFATALTVVDTAVTAGVYRATLWVRGAPEPGTRIEAFARLDVRDASGNSTQLGQAAELLATPSWQQLVTGVRAVGGGAELRLIVDVRPTNACVIVDDLVVERLP